MEELQTMEELQARFSSQKSFYGKAKTFKRNGAIYLMSYDTIVAKIENGKFTYLWEGWSMTTQNHVNEFLLQHEFNKLSKKELINARGE